MGNALDGNLATVNTHEAAYFTRRRMLPNILLELLRLENVPGDALGIYGFVTGYKIYTHPIEIDNGVSLPLLRNTLQEDYPLNLARQILRAGDTALDLGANLGCWTIPLAGMVGPMGKVIAFEPEKANFKLLRKNVAVNGMMQVQLVSLAVLQDTGRILLFLSPRNAGDHRVWDNTGYHHTWDTNTPRQTVEVYATSLDRYFGLDRGVSPPIIRLIKLDIQGSEVLALRGAQRLLAAQESLALFLELWPVGLDCAARCEDGVEQLQRLLQAHQFRCWHIDDKQKKLVAVTALSRLVDKSSGYFTNLLCIKGNIELPSFEG